MTHPPYPPSCTYHSQVLKRPCRLDILQRLLQVLQLSIHLALRRLRALHGLRLERINSLQLALYIVLLGLEGTELLLDIVDDGAVLQDGAVVRKVDFLRLFGEELDFAARVVIALLEGGEGLGGAASEAELVAQVCPVDLEGGGALWEWLVCCPFGRFEGGGAQPEAMA